MEQPFRGCAKKMCHLSDIYHFNYNNSRYNFYSAVRIHLALKYEKSLHILWENCQMGPLIFDVIYSRGFARGCTGMLKGALSCRTVEWRIIKGAFGRGPFLALTFHKRFWHFAKFILGPFVRFLSCFLYFWALMKTFLSNSPSPRRRFIRIQLQIS